MATAPTNPPSVTDLPEPPVRDGSITNQEFSNRSGTFVNALANDYQPEVNALSDWMNDTAQEVYNNAVETEANAQIAAATGNYQGEWSTLTGAYSKGVGVSESGVFYRLKVDVADITTVQPSANPATWDKIVNASVVALGGRAKFASFADLGSGTTLDGQLDLATIQAMNTNNIPVHTTGYYAGSTDGEGEYSVLTTAEKSAAGYDGLDKAAIEIDLGSGGTGYWMCLKVGSFIDIRQFGAVSDSEAAASDNVTRINSLMVFANGFGFEKVPAIKIPTGKFYVNDSITVLSYIRMFGDGDMSIISLTPDVPAGTYSILEITTAAANSIVLESFSIWGDNNNQANSPTVYGLDINTTAPIIYSRFEQLYIKECQNSALIIRGGGGADNCFFTGCMFRDSKGDANVVINSADKISFTQCRFRSGKVGSGHGMLIDNAGALRVTIDGGCRFDDNNGWAVFASNTSGQIKISNFQATNNGSGGVYLDRCDDSQITDGFLADNGDAATDAQIKVELSNNVLVDATIKGGVGYGVYLKNSDDCEVRTKISDRSTITAFAVYVDVCDGTQLSGSITDCGGHGVFNDNSSEGFYSNLKIKNIGQVTNNIYSGVVLDNNSDRNTVQLVKMNSSATNKPQYGVWVANASANDNLVTNNDLLGYVTAGIQDSGTGTVTVAGNRT